MKHSLGVSLVLLLTFLFSRGGGLFVPYILDPSVQLIPSASTLISPELLARNSQKFYLLSYLANSAHFIRCYPLVWLVRNRRKSLEDETLRLALHSLAARAVSSNSMEVEIKLKLPDSAAHQKLSDLLSPFHLKTLTQENIFFDSPGNELAKNLAALRIRFYNLDSHCVISLKAKPILSEGISRVEEEEEPVDPVLARALVAEPSRILSASASNIVKRVREEYGVKELVCLGGFRNVRSVYEWKGLKLELDETVYDFGTSHEIECETMEPDRDRKLIEGLLIENGVRYSYSSMNKFAVFRSGKLPG